MHYSTDGGMSWSEIGMRLPASFGCNSPVVLDANTFLAGCGAPFGGGGVVRSTDAGMSWTSVSKTGGASAPLVASDQTIYWPAPTGQVMVKSTDLGKTWTESSNQVGYLHPIELPDKKRIAALGGSYIMVSADHATTWTKVVLTPYNEGIQGLAYSKHQKAFFVWHATCGNGTVHVGPNEIMRYNWDYTAN
jgi:photosystem II stability/assembly factor-like uncharacterized protein